MGSQKDTFAKDMIKELNSRVDGLGHPHNCIAWKTIFWADILKDRQDKYLERANKENDLDYIRLRKIIISNFGDASAYRKTKTSGTYKAIHARVRTAINEVYKEVQSKNVPLLILVHSLGGHIMSNYIWDMQEAIRAGDKTKKKKILNDNPSAAPCFECMETLAGIVTFGCNIPLFTFAYSPVVPITFPPNNLPNNLKKKAKWYNYYDADDVLGYPLKAIDSRRARNCNIPTYKKTVNQDIQINVGGFLSSWNPLSHLGYWTDDDFTKPVAKFIINFL